MCQWGAQGCRGAQGHRGTGAHRGTGNRGRYPCAKENTSVEQGNRGTGAQGRRGAGEGAKAPMGSTLDHWNTGAQGNRGIVVQRIPRVQGTLLNTSVEQGSRGTGDTVTIDKTSSKGLTIDKS